jgi:hypothetical protein
MAPKWRVRVAAKLRSPGVDSNARRASNRQGVKGIPAVSTAQ